MKTIHAICALALLVFILLFSLAGINSALQFSEALQVYSDTLTGEPLLFLRLALVVLTLTLIYLLSFGRGRRRDSQLQFRTEGGTVEVSLSAAASYLSRLKKEFAAVVSLDPKLRIKGQGLAVTMKTGIKSGTRIPELSNLIQQRARQCLSEDLGLENIVDIKIAISEISGPPPSPEGDSSVIHVEDREEERD
jgi:uncharacterized alkaline shock family protein YloU